MLNVHDITTNVGLHFHLSLKDEESFYILVYDFYNFVVSMKFFNNSIDAKKFIEELI